MRPGFGSSSAAAATGGGAARFWRWGSPMPYLFGGLAVMMGLIAVALIILVCSNRKSRRHDGPVDVGKPAALAPLDVEPPTRIVVIMAGDAIPSFLAKAVPSSPLQLSHAEAISP